eukprot:CAMPEP_0116128342 /NCGR_PEP_ID=MMETSP0329-20121206/7312_1 /TAXON_ID=697910 /ORGANISM="Pseudo-nitzschia arenysensis, Strain B593" /LENGTH=358 /DNA_ID=CAMNT_0003622481 /DNA_START=126 /DNA_END=1202 /DNA_ORIENTATION=-
MMREVASLLLLLVSCRAFIPTTTSTSKIRTSDQNLPFNLKPITTTVALSTNDVNAEVKSSNSTVTRPSFWKPKAAKSRWKERFLLEDLEIGQEISGHVVQDFLEAKTGPKLYFECGVGRINRLGNWSIVNGMLRLDRGKASVARKRAARFRNKDSVQLYVSRIQKECGRLEVSAKIEDVKKYTSEPKISVTSLQKNQEVIGKVVKLHPYGAIIDIGANVKGLLHITKVASVMNRYIDKEEGLKSAGLERGAKVRLMVESIEKRRLSLDFTEDVKEEASREKMKEKETANEKQPLAEENGYSQEDLDAWAEYASQGVQTEKPEEEVVDDDDDDDFDDEYEYDHYDEEMDIESSLGLDMY